MEELIRRIFKLKVKLYTFKGKNSATVHIARILNFSRRQLLKMMMMTEHVFLPPFAVRVNCQKKEFAFEREVLLFNSRPLSGKV